MSNIPYQGYLKNIYSETERPKSVYPLLLAKRLIKIHEIKKGTKILDLGAGRAEVSQGFSQMGNIVFAFDRDDTFLKEITDYGINFVHGDINKSELPFENETFDLVYSKSFLEHMDDPERVLRECYRILRPGGRILHLVPDWEANYKIYFDDHTHKTPFTKVTMRDLYRVCGFTPGKIQTFRQLPSTWNYPILNYPLDVIAPFIPVRTNIKFLRWTRELMIEGIGKKP